MNRVLTILEVSQKQAYIFSSNKLKENILNSAIIAHALSGEYIADKLQNLGYTEDENMVYAGGGHTILTFDGFSIARECTQKLTESIYRDFNGLTVFAKSIAYEDGLTVEDNLKNLTRALERKKSVRKAAFHKGSFGVERIDATTLKPVLVNNNSSTEMQNVSNEEANYAKKICPKGYQPVFEFDKLGGTENDSNFVAVVHIDGNGMGARVENLYKNGAINNHDFDIARKQLKEFSQCIDMQFKEAFKDMLDAVKTELDTKGSVYDALSIKEDKNTGCQDFPVRKIITAGDDICFVAEGRIGIECAVKFIEALNKKVNVIDNQNYSACAGVAIVHRKYPFYKAYDLAEMLCSNAKSFNATIHPEDNGQGISSIDWHIEYGEIGDSMDEIRKQYRTKDGGRLYLRPYIVDGAELVEGNSKIYHSYQKFKKEFCKLSNKADRVANGKMKEMRNALKRGEMETIFYIQSNLLEDVFAPKYEFVEDYDFVKSSAHFDAIELLDTYLPFESKEGN